MQCIANKAWFLGQMSRLTCFSRNFFVTIVVTVALVLCLPSVAKAQQADAGEPPRFFSVLPDIPLMSGMIEDEAGSVVYDKPEGRIIRARGVSGMIDTAKINNFYDDTLPHLGWMPEGNQPGRYVRGYEVLRVTIYSDERGGTVLEMTLMPRG